MSNKFIKVERNFTVTKSLNDEGVFEGYASVFDTEDHEGDTVMKGAFKKGLAKIAKERRKLKMLWTHDRHQVIGTFTEASEDDKGLYVRGKLTLGVQKADETRLLMLDGAIDAMSIGGYVIKDMHDNKTGKRQFHEIELREISPCAFPALDAARIVSVKSLMDDAGIPEVEACLRDVGGFSLKEAKRIISVIKAATPHRDVEKAAQLVQSAINCLKG